MGVVYLLHGETSSTRRSNACCAGVAVDAIEDDYVQLVAGHSFVENDHTIANRLIIA